MIFDERYFHYNTFVSKNYNLVFAHTDTNPFLGLGGEPSPLTVYNKKNRRRYFIDDSYKDSTLEFETEILTCDGSPIPTADRDAIESALFYHPGYAKLRFYSFNGENTFIGKGVTETSVLSVELDAASRETSDNVNSYTKILDEAPAFVDDSNYYLKVDDAVYPLTVSDFGPDYNDWYASYNYNESELAPVDPFEPFFYIDYGVTFDDRKAFIMGTYENLDGKTVEIISRKTSDVGTADDVYLNCRFINPSVVQDGDGNVVGYHVTVSSETPYLLQDFLRTETLVYSGTTIENKPVSVRARCPGAGYVYPAIDLIVTGGKCNVRIVNETDDGGRVSSIRDLLGGASLTIDSELNTVIGGDRDYYSDFSTSNFPRLKPGNNTLYISEVNPSNPGLQVDGITLGVTIRFRNQLYLSTPLDDEVVGA